MKAFGVTAVLFAAALPQAGALLVAVGPPRPLVSSVKSGARWTTATATLTSSQHAKKLQAQTTTTATSFSAADNSSRRAFLSAAVAAAFLINVQPASALPMVTTAEFITISRDSARSIDRVEFSGPQSANVVVRLVDGTAFGIRDVVESATDPRSPLKIAALCKANNISYRFVDLEAYLAATPRKKKVYANARVLEAAEKQKEKAVRMQQDEELRQEELAEMRRL
jgi:hypothetical protein